MLSEISTHWANKSKLVCVWSMFLSRTQRTPTSVWKVVRTFPLDLGVLYVRTNPFRHPQQHSLAPKVVDLQNLLPRARTRSRHNYGPAVFASSQNGPCIIIDSPYRVSVFSLKNHHPFSMVFAWLWGYEFAVLPMFSIHVQHTRLKNNGLFCLSTWRPSQPASSTCLRYPNLHEQRYIIRVTWMLTSHPTPPQSPRAA